MKQSGVKVYNWQWKSVVDPVRGTVWSWPYPVVFLNIHIFAFPLKDQIVRARGWPLLDYSLFVLSCVGESSIRAKAMTHTGGLLLPFGLLSCFYSVESGAVDRDGGVGARGRLNWSSFLHFSRFLFVFFNPEFMIGLVEFQMRDVQMRIAVAWSRS